MLILSLLAISVTGCPLNNKEEEVEGAPTIPPLTTFVIDFDEFTAEGDTTPASFDAAAVMQSAGFTFGSDDLYSSGQYVAANKQNWNFAALNVGVWSLFIAAGMLVPSAAFVASFNHTPQQQPDYSWRWSYNVMVVVSLYSAELHGEFIDDYNGTDAGVRWDMYISKQGDYEDFHWFYGESNLPATEGFWILKNDPSDPTDLVQIDWDRNLAQNTYSIKYTNIVPNGPENGGYLYHGATTDESYDRFFEIHNKGANNYVYIEWNSTTQAGRVKAKHQFGNNNWYCWGSDHQNADCSA